MDPFSNAELQTIDDLKELKDVLQNVTMGRYKYGKVLSLGMVLTLLDRLKRLNIFGLGLKQPTIVISSLLQDYLLLQMLHQKLHLEFDGIL